MKIYVITTGTIFGVIALAHIARMITEGSHVATDPWFLALTVVAAALCGWALKLLRSASRP